MKSNVPHHKELTQRSTSSAATSSTLPPLSRNLDLVSRRRGEQRESKRARGGEGVSKRGSLVSLFPRVIPSLVFRPRFFELEILPFRARTHTRAKKGRGGGEKRGERGEKRTDKRKKGNICRSVSRRGWKL